MYIVIKFWCYNKERKRNFDINQRANTKQYKSDIFTERFKTLIVSVFADGETSNVLKVQ